MNLGNNHKTSTIQQTKQNSEVKLHISSVILNN